MVEPVDAAVVMTVLNEAATLPPLLDSLAAQTIRPAAIIVVDGGSRDGTPDVVSAYAARLPGLRLLAAPGSNIAAGRNAGIAAAGTAFIAITDGGCTVAPDWLAELLRPLLAGTADLTLAHVEPAPANHKEACIGACTMTQLTRIGGQRLHTHGRGLALRRTLWAELGGFPESFDRCEDTLLIMAAAAAGARLRAAPAARVYWRPRRGYRPVLRQYYGYARDLARAGYSRHFHLKTMLQGAAGGLLLVWGLGQPGPLPWLLLLLAAAAYLARKAGAGCFDVPGWRTYYRVPLVLAAVLLGTMAGVVVGLSLKLRDSWN